MANAYLVVIYNKIIDKEKLQTYAVDPFQPGCLTALRKH